MHEALYAQIVERLDIQNVDNDTSALVLAAFTGDLGEVLDGARDAPQQAAAPAVATEGAYLQDLTVEGFRGIGPRATLSLRPGPGLTLVLGRNGSGKSSFAEALELLLTGTNKRWENRPKVWQEGWRCMHHPSAAIAATFVVEGTGEVRVQRTWDDDTGLADAEAEVLRTGRQAETLDALGWSHAVDSYRPLLSYNELSSWFDEGPSVLYDALASMLGLDTLVDAQRRLREERLARSRAQRDVKDRLQPILVELESTDDERADAATAILQKRTWDLDALDRVLEGAGTDGGDDVEVLRALAAVQAPDPDDVTAAAIRVGQASQRVRDVQATDSGRARQTAQLLGEALAHHESHGDDACPVCGSGRLDATWRDRTRAEIDRLTRLAADADDAHRELHEALGYTRSLVATPPAMLERAAAVGIDAGAATSVWKQWAQVPDEPDALAAHMQTHVVALADEVSRLRERARAELERREDAWRPVAKRLIAWLQTARPALDAAEAVATLKRAEDWMKDATAQIRDERFAPLAGEAQHIWTLLRQQSNVSLGAIRLEGSGTQRRVSLDVTVDGSDGSALGVMSQGELNSLALSLFLPRATLPESPFRFVVIDDPVQSMDPTKVDGLARVLERAATSRQVLVFTHDARLSEAVRRLGIDAVILDVRRRPGSVVSIDESLDPARRYTYDAFALARTEDLPSKVAARVIPGMLRMAIEASCVEAVTRRRLRAGAAHEALDDELDQLHRTSEYMALALFDDASRGGDVLARLHRDLGRMAADAFQLCNKGAHEGIQADLQELVRAVEGLCRYVQGQR